MRRCFSMLAGSLVLFSFLAAPAAASAQTQTERFVPGSTVEGVSYFLPRTALRVVIKAEKRVVTPGDFNMYAFKYMRLQDVPVRSSTTWTLKDISLLPYGVPDKAKAYSIKLKGRTVAPLVSLSREGLLLGINTMEAEETVLPPLPAERVLEKGIPSSVARQYMNREMLQAGSAAKMAELVAREIYDMRESRDALIRGEADNVPKDGAQLKLMLDNLDAQQRALVSLFGGSVDVSEICFVLDVVPDTEDEKSLLFRFSRWTGLVDADDMSGVPYYMSVRRIGDLPEPSPEAGIEAKKGKLERTVRYNVPARTEISIFNAEKVFVRQEVPVAQFGYEEILSNVLFDKMSATEVTFYQSTGGIKKIKADAAK